MVQWKGHCIWIKSTQELILVPLCDHGQVKDFSSVSGLPTANGRASEVWSQWEVLEVLTSREHFFDL